MLLGTLELDGKPAQKSLEELNSKFDKALSGFSKFGKMAAGGFLLGGALQKVMEGFGGVLEMGSRLQSMHLSTGESVHDLYIFEKALVRAGGSAEIAQNFIFKLQNALAGVNEDNQKTADSFALLGTSAAELRNMPLLEQVKTLQKGLAGVSDQAQKVAIVKNLFGFRSAASAMPLLSNPEALTSAMAGSEKMATLMDRNAHAFHDLELAIKSVKGNMTEFMAGALEVLAPDATNLANALGSIDFIGFGRAAGQFLDVLLQLAKVLVSLGPLIQTVGDALGSLSGGTIKGAAVGAGIGRFFGPLGMLLGSVLGGGIGSLFGGDEKKPSAHFAENFRGLGDAPKVMRDAPVSALQRVGLGGNFGGGDPLLVENQRQTKELQKLNSNFEKWQHAFRPQVSAPPV